MTQSDLGGLGQKGGNLYNNLKLLNGLRGQALFLSSLILVPPRATNRATGFKIVGILESNLLTWIKQKQSCLPTSAPKPQGIIRDRMGNANEHSCPACKAQTHTDPEIVN